MNHMIDKNKSQINREMNFLFDVCLFVCSKQSHFFFLVFDQTNKTDPPTCTIPKRFFFFIFNLIGTNEQKKNTGLFISERRGQKCGV
jgi:hypothetical protein